ncbi:MAG: hypothetical protein E7448_08090 [Ruminococcaceae bacterium]|nr:hypothetical protein [Oscillospiraceae bacterium]
MKVIFLDIDGVLNCSEYRRRQMLQGKISVILQVEPLSQLKRIVEATDASIVLISSWRKFWKREGSVDTAGQQIEQRLSNFGLFVADKTPVLSDGSRSREVAQWLKNKNYVEHYVILDDKDYLWDRKQTLHWVRCPDETGLTDELATAAINILNGQLPTHRKKSRLETIFRKWFH